MVAAFLFAPALIAQTTPAQPASGQNDNPFPGEPTAGQAVGQTGQTGGAKSKQDAAKPDAAKPGAEGDNPFPGESSDVPVIPVDPGPGGNATPGGNARPGAAEDGGRAAPDPDGDPVKSPDAAGTPADDGFSSSRTGLKQTPVEEDAEATPGKSGKKKTREQILKEDVDVGNFYLDRKNWKAAQGRFEAAYALNSENPDAVWGLAEAERHLNLNEKAREHYELFLTYDAEGPHGKAARKALEQIEGGNKGSIPLK